MTGRHRLRPPARPRSPGAAREPHRTRQLAPVLAPPVSALPVLVPPVPAELRGQAPSALAQVVSRRVAFPGAASSAPSFDDEIDVAVSYEKGLVIKAVLAIGLVLLVLAVRMFFSG